MTVWLKNENAITISLTLMSRRNIKYILRNVPVFILFVCYQESHWDGIMRIKKNINSYARKVHTIKNELFVFVFNNG